MLKKIFGMLRTKIERKSAPMADGNVVPAESGAPLRRLTTIIPR